MLPVTNEMLADLPADVADLVAHAPPAEGMKLLERSALGTSAQH